MAAKRFICDIDLGRNSILNAVVQNLATDPTTPIKGLIYYNTASDQYKGWNGTAWEVLGGGTGYTHPSFTPLTPTLTGANVLATFETNAEGHVIAATTRALTLSDLSYTPYSHPNDGVDLGAALTGATVISDVNVNAAGHVTGFATRALTPTDIGAVIINDAVTNATDAWSSTKIAAEIAAAVTGGMDLKGDYNASTNTPDLDTAASGILKGDVFVVSAAGLFFTEQVEIGDTLISKQNDPTTLAHWIRVERNIPDIVDASESAKGIVQLASQADVITGTDALKAVTPATLQAKIDALVLLRKFNQNVGDGAATTITVTHNLNSADAFVKLKEIATNEDIECAITTPTANTAQLTFNVAPTSNQYRVSVIA